MNGEYRVFKDSDFDAKPGTWNVICEAVPQTKGEDTPGKVISATLRCRNGHYGSLEDHEIADNGEVYPSVDCPVSGCDFHENVILDGWEAETPA